MSRSAIELRNVVKTYGDTRALDGISLTVERGEIFGYLGPNGAGKSTTMQLLTGIADPTEGEVFVAGISVRRDPLEAKRRLGFVPESGAVFDRLTPREHLGVIAGLYEIPAERARRRIGELLEYFDLSERADERLDTLSLGMCRKVCLMAAMLHDPAVLLLDEPLNGLDAHSVARVKDLIRRLAEQGRTIFYTSHVLDVVERICTRVAVIDRGRLLGVGSVDEIRNRGDAATLEAALLRMWRPEGQ